MKFKLLLAALFVGIGVGYSQVGPKDLAEKFFKDFESKGSTYALDNLYATNKWMSRSADAITNLKSQMEGLNDEYVGKYYGYELIVEKALTESYILLSYMVKFDRQPLRYTFQFYKPDDKWVVYSFKFDSNMDDELEESAKLYYLRLY